MGILISDQEMGLRTEWHGGLWSCILFPEFLNVLPSTMETSTALYQAPEG